MVAAVGCAEAADRTRMPIATIDGAPIYVDEFARALRRLVVAEAPPETLPVQKRKLLDDMIDRHLLLRAAERQPVVVGMDEVEALYERTRRGWENDRDEPCEECRFQAELAGHDLTAAELKQTLRQQLMIKRYVEEQVFVRLAVPEREVSAYLQAHPDLAELPEQVRAAQIVVKTRAEADAIRADLQRGTSFEDAALKYSRSPEGQKGGGLGTFARGVMPSAVEAACFALAEGKVSDVVASDYGFHLFKVYERWPARPREPGEVRAGVEGLLLKEKRHAAERTVFAALRQAAAINVEEDLLAQVH